MIRFVHDNFLTLSEADLAQWLNQIAAKEGYTVKELEYNFVDKDTMLALNQKQLNHNTHTDIITFDYSETKEIIAEAYISCYALSKNAKKYTQTVDNECLRLLCHALLHCFGFNDKSREQKEQMRSKEETYINLFHVKH